MANRRNLVKTIDVHVMLPADLMALIYARLHDPEKGRIPLGAQARFFEAAARSHLATMEAPIAQT